MVRAVLDSSNEDTGEAGDEGTDPPDPGQPITLGRDADSDADIDLDPLSLAKHTAVFAGSGSGKTAVPMCLSHHPGSALPEDEVLRRASV